ncbi:putative protein OS=Streptomyces lavendulae subsp. lavendulae OX=58340 GN=SLAV_21155 PE=4 SV=1 [Streptomyces lavendulae subsp. lavendulae]
MAFALGGAGVAEATLTHARRPPLALRPSTIGPARRPGLYYPLGDGTDPAGWDTLSTLLAHLRTTV